MGKITAEYWDAHLRAIDATWPDDPNVPDMPPIPATEQVPFPQDNWLNRHAWNGMHDPLEQPDPPRSYNTIPISEENPLKADVIWSMRSPYCSLATQRLVWLNSNYNVDIRFRCIMPQAVRNSSGGSAAAGPFALDYKYTHTMVDCQRTAAFEGIAYKWPTPDPIWQVSHPPHGENWQYVHPPEKQPYIFWIVRLACYCELQGKSVDYQNAVHRMIWSAQVDHWPNHIKAWVNGIDGIDYDEAITFIQEHSDKVDAVWQENTLKSVQTGHGGVPMMIFNGEPFFGHDRVYQFIGRLMENGLTKRKEPRAPFTTQPKTWPDRW